MVWELPKSLTVNNIEYEIRTDFRAILDILNVFRDPNYEHDEKWLCCLIILYVDFDDMPKDDYKEACERARWFIDCGKPETDDNKPSLMDWEQDAPMVIPAINRVLGYECRAVEYLHWWTFVGAYMEIGESLFSNVLSIRHKRAKGQHLEKWETDFLMENRDIVMLKKRLTDEEQDEYEAEQEALKKLLGE